MSESPNVWNWAENRYSQRRFAAHLPVVSDTQKRICSELNSRGIAITPIREFIPEERYVLVKNQAIEFSKGSKIRSRTDEYERNYLDPSWVQSWRKDYLVTKFELDDVVAFTDPLLQLAVSPELLDTVNLYLGLYSRLFLLNYWYTIPLSKTDRLRVASQNWHRDPEDHKLVKVFIYYTRVDESAGPLEYILESRQGQRYYNMWPGSSYPPPDQVDQRVPTEDRVVATGPEGTIIFCDTSGFHRGGFALENARLLSVFAYISPASPYNSQRPFAVDLTTMPAGQRQAVAESLAKVAAPPVHPPFRRFLRRS
jgi:hypothetical protein